MSNINTNGINGSYPTPGTNNSTQGFRDNFTNIKNNLNTASTEITDLQSKAIVKAPLTNITLNNDMANTLISNAAVKGFRQVTYSMGNQIPTIETDGSVVIDVTKADIHTGSIVGNTGFMFAGWPASGTKAEIELHLNVSAAPNSSITFPETSYDSNGIITTGPSDSAKLLENYISKYSSNSAVFNYTPGANMANVTHTNSVGVPAGVKELVFKITTLDCGQTLDIEPVNRNQKATQIQLRTIGADIGEFGEGQAGDVKGAITTDGFNLYVCSNTYPTDATRIEVTNTRANLLVANTIVTSGYFAKESDTGLFKLGDGASHFGDLGYYYIWKRIPLGILGDMYPPAA